MAWKTVSIPYKGTNSCFRHQVQTGSGILPASYSVALEALWSKIKRPNDQGVKLTIRFHLIPRLRISGNLPPLPYIFSSCISTILPSLLTILILSSQLLLGLSTVKLYISLLFLKFQRALTMVDYT